VRIPLGYCFEYENTVEKKKSIVRYNFLDRDREYVIDSNMMAAPTGPPHNNNIMILCYSNS